MFTAMEETQKGTRRAWRCGGGEVGEKRFKKLVFEVLFITK